MLKENPHYPHHVFKLKRALYDLKQAPQAWYERLTNFLIEKGYERGGLIKHCSLERINVILSLLKFMLRIGRLVHVCFMRAVEWYMNHVV